MTDKILYRQIQGKQCITGFIIDGIEISMLRAMHKYNIGRMTIRKRLKLGWSIKTAVESPVTFTARDTMPKRMVHRTVSDRQAALAVELAATKTRDTAIRRRDERILFRGRRMHAKAAVELVAEDRRIGSELGEVWE